MPSVGSLFSGIGGLDAGLRRAGWGHAFLCESDPYRRDALRVHFPGVPIYEDVREVDATAWPARNGAGRRALGGEPDASAADLSLDNSTGLDLLCGGFPCQDVSVAGRRAGLAGEQSGLFFEFARVAEALRSHLLLVENVPGLLSSNGGRDFGVLLGTLADLGYGLAWRILDSRFFGVPQRRRRMFIVGALANGDPRAAAERAGQILAVGQGCERHSKTGGKARAGVASALSGRSPSRLDDQGSGQLVVSHTLTNEGHNASEDGTGRGTPLVAAPLSHGSNPNSNMAGRRREDDENLVIVGPLGGGNDGIERRSKDDPSLIACPLAWRGRDGGSELEVGEANIYNALRAGDGGSSRLNQVMVGTGVRRLTPRECERLQAFPDDWTQLGGTSDSRRYAALGDAVTVNVAEWIGRRLGLAVS